MKKTFILPLALAGVLLLCGCSTEATNGLIIASGSMATWDSETTANYYLNYSKASYVVDGTAGVTNELLYLQNKITPPTLLSAPEDPVRTGYEFRGWFTDKECTSAWDFDSSIAESSVFLYAGWTLTGEDGYTEPVYNPIVTIDDTMEDNFKITGILNVAPLYGICYLTAGGLLRLSNSPSDVVFALNYAKKTGVEIKSAVYASAQSKITVVSVKDGNEETDEIGVKLTTANLALANSTYEAKAVAYEAAGAAKENYHVMLAGSSSIEFWETYAKDLDPIVTYSHGIGGTTSDQWTASLLDRLIVPYCPKAIVYYVGINDLVNSGDSVDKIVQNVEQLLSSTHTKLPTAHVFYVYLNVLPGYFLSYDENIRTINSTLASFIAGKDWVEGVDAGAALMKENGDPDAGYYRLDNLHMSYYGYVLWAAEIRKALEAWLG